MSSVGRDVLRNSFARTAVGPIRRERMGYLSECARMWFSDPPRFAINERVLVPSAQRVATVIEVARRGNAFGYRLAGLGKAVIAESDIERIAIDGRQNNKNTAENKEKPWFLWSRAFPHG